MNMPTMFYKKVFLGIFSTLCNLAFGDDRIGAKDFIENALTLGIFEVEAGKLALKRSTTDDVKTFAKMSIADHTNVNEEITRIASQKSIKSVFEAGLVVNARKTAFEQYDAHPFDELYVKDRINAYEKMINLIQRASVSKDKEIAIFAQKTLPIFLHHLNKVRELGNTVKSP